MEFGDICDVVYTLWIQDYSALEYNPKDVRAKIDEVLNESYTHLSAVPDRETWGTTPEDIAAQHRMEALALKSQKK